MNMICRLVYETSLLLRVEPELNFFELEKQRVGEAYFYRYEAK